MELIPSGLKNRPLSETELRNLGSGNYHLKVRQQTALPGGDMVYRSVFDEHPYSRPIKGTPEHLRQILPSDLKSWWNKFARPDQTALIFAGDITQEKAAMLAGKYLGQWKTVSAETPQVPADVPTPKPTHIVLVDRPGSAQAQLHVGHLGITRNKRAGLLRPDGCELFRGAFNSRLNENIPCQTG